MGNADSGQGRRGHAAVAWLGGYAATACAALITLFWLVFVLAPVIAGAPGNGLAFSLLRAPMLLLAAVLVVHHAFIHLKAGRLRRSWLLIGAAIGSVCIGEAWRIAMMWQGAVNPVFGVSDVFYLAYFPLLLAGLVQLPRIFHGRSDLLKFLLDCATVAFGAGMFVWHLGIRPALVANAHSEPLAVVVAIAYPLGDLLTIVGIATVLFIFFSLLVYLVLGTAPAAILVFVGGFNGLILPIGLSIFTYVGFARPDLMGGHRYNRPLLIASAVVCALTWYMGWKSVGTIFAFLTA